MRQVKLGATGLVTSALGFGCASLGSRIGARDGLAAMAEAEEAGVAWFDLAPAYGRGEAETIAASFLKGRRDRVGIATKVGLAAPAAGGGLAAAILPLARRAVAAFPPLRALLRRSPAQGLRRLPLTPDLIRGSLEESLRRLGTDHVDLYALHEPAPEEIGRDEILRALEAVLEAGKARAIGVAGDTAAGAAALAQGTPFGVVQLAAPEPGAASGLAEAAGQGGFGVVLHSVFGVGGAFERLGRRLDADPAAARRLAEAAGVAEPRAALARLLLGRALARNPEALVLVSMFSARSRAANLAVLAAPPDAAALAELEALARAEPEALGRQAEAG